MSTTANILRLAAVATFAAVVCGTAGPAAADPCVADPATLAVTCPPEPPKTGVAGFAEKLPDLSLWHFLGVGLIAMGVIAVMANRDKSDRSQTLQPGTARAGAYRADKRSERSIGWFGIGLGTIALGYAFGGVAGLVVGGVIGGLIVLPALKTGAAADEAKTGYAQADEAWRHDVEMAKLNAQLHQPNPATTTRWASGSHRLLRRRCSSRPSL